MERPTTTRFAPPTAATVRARTRQAPRRTPASCAGARHSSEPTQRHRATGSRNTGAMAISSPTRSRAIPLTLRYPSRGLTLHLGAATADRCVRSAAPWRRNRSHSVAVLFGHVFHVRRRLTDGQPHWIALYLLDYDFGGREQTVDVVDASTKPVSTAES